MIALQNLHTHSTMCDGMVCVVIVGKVLAGILAVLLALLVYRRVYRDRSGEEN